MDEVNLPLRAIAVIITLTSALYGILFSTYWQISNQKFNLNKLFIDLIISDKINEPCKSNLRQTFIKYKLMEVEEKPFLGFLAILFYAYLFSVTGLLLLSPFVIFDLVKINISELKPYGVVYGLFLLLSFLITLGFMVKIFGPAKYIEISQEISKEFFDEINEVKVVPNS